MLFFCSLSKGSFLRYSFKEFRTCRVNKYKSLKK
nr:MAG TPA: hypothetical protein [Caudoviricetes sp.]